MMFARLIPAYQLPYNEMERGLLYEEGILEFRRATMRL
jgi:hypothetical protein